MSLRNVYIDVRKEKELRIVALSCGSCYEKLNCPNGSNKYVLIEGGKRFF